MSGERDKAVAVIGWRVQNLVLDLVREVRGGTVIEPRSRYGSDQFPEQAPAPLAGVWGAQLLAGRIGREVIFHVRRAREAGHSWDEIGQSLGLESTPDRTRAKAAFGHVACAPSDPLSWREPSFGWRCFGCDQLISDFGPHDATPASAELGHAEDCSQLAAEVDRWSAARDRGDRDVNPVQRQLQHDGGIDHESRRLDF